MTTEEKARPTVGAAGRAVETGAASRQTTTSTNDFNTAPAERQPLQIADLLLPGAEHAIPRRTLWIPGQGTASADRG